MRCFIIPMPVRLINLEDAGQSVQKLEGELSSTIRWRSVMILMTSLADILLEN